MESTGSERKSFPTILIAHDDAEVRQSLTASLRLDYNVLEAPDLPSMVEFVLTQTCPIHLLLTDPSTAKRTWATRLKNYRRSMAVLFVAGLQNSEEADVMSPETAISSVRAFFSRGQSVAMAG